MRITDAIARFLGFGEKRSGGVEWFGVGDSSSSTMTVDRAVTLAPVFASFRHLIDYISTLPVDFYRVDGPRREKVGRPELIRNIDEEYSLEAWVGQAVFGLLANGNAVGRITHMRRPGRPTLVRWVGNWSGGDDGIPWWIDGDPLPNSLVAHIPWLVPPGKRLGLSPIEHYATVAQAGLSAQEYADVKRGGGIPPVVLMNKQRELTAEVAAAAAAKAATSFATGKPFVTGNDWDLKAMDIPPNHAQFIATLGLSANAIAGIYGIDPREIGGSGTDDSITYSNDESRALNRAANARPYATRLEQAINRWLPGSTEIKFNMNAGIRADIKTRTEVVGAQIADGRLSVNEARALEDLAPVPGGDFHNVPTPKVEPAQREGVSP